MGLKQEASMKDPDEQCLSPRKQKMTREVTGREHRFGEETGMDALCL